MINTNLILKFKIWSRKLSVRASLYCVGAILSALISIFFSKFVPDQFAELLGGDAIDKILNIFATSMLVVVTFSMATLVSTYSILSNIATPRSTKLIIEDTSAHKALSAFLGAFIFSMVSLIALSTKYYGREGRAILFIITILVISIVLWTIISWIGQLSHLGHLSHLIEKIEKVTKSAIKNHNFYFEWRSEPHTALNESDAISYVQEESGYIQSIDREKLDAIAKQHATFIFIKVTVGEYIYPGFILGKISKDTYNVDLEKKISSCFLIGTNRAFDQDPRLGFIVLSEAASRALSPGINDPGSAIQIIGSLVRLAFYISQDNKEERLQKANSRVYYKTISADDILDDAFNAIGRDGAGHVEVGIALQKGLNALEGLNLFKAAAHKQSLLALERAKKSLDNPEDLRRVTTAYSASKQK